jgi:outer membrane protein OmpA-like peptidoglycan-associated protein
MQIAAEHRNTIKVLSERRVEITKRFLVGRGIPETNLSTKAYGEEENMTPE